MKRVSIIQRLIPHYRVRFFEQLYVQGAQQGLEITVYSGAPPALADSSPAFPFQVLPTRYFGRRNIDPCWIHGLEEAIKGSDVIVAPQELQCLTVPYLWLRRSRLCRSWVWWGHGFDSRGLSHASVATQVKEVIKRFMTRRADGLITYTTGGADYWRKRGLPEERLIPCYNTIDVEGLRAAGAEITAAQRVRLRQRLRLEGKRVLLFSGRLYAEKKVDFLLTAFALLKNQCPEAVLFIVGDGKDRHDLEHEANRLELEDVHFLGELTDPKVTAAYFSLAEIMVIPGLVGLAIVHGFAFGLPLVTTQHGYHSVEIEYLSEDTGISTTHDASAYAEAIAALLSDRQRLTAMQSAALRKGSELQLPLSAQRYVEGIRSLAAHKP